ncbi:MAG: relaxase/mobilization nuclease domain-containing protein [Bacteroidaceae bacterium]|nr:relaxase/mobilization nuclease domain-containing protein [Bacteroidaceae bacterium]
MIAKIKTRESFAGIVDYAHDYNNDKKKARLIDYKDVCIISNKSIADSFSIQASMRSKIAKPVKHISLGFSPNDVHLFTDDEKGDELMVRIAKDWMKEMSITNTQYIIARHLDTEHPHCHLVFNRIDNDGNVISDSRERIRNMAVCKLLNKKYGLYVAPSKSKKIHEDRLRGYEAKKHKLRMDINNILDRSSNWDDFCRLLKETGISIRFFTSSQTNTIRGISFANHQISISGSKLEPKVLTYGQLCFKLGERRIQGSSNPYEEKSLSPFVKDEVSANHSNGHAITTESNLSESGSTGNTSSSAVGEAMIELLLQPHQVETGGGGGGSDNRGWRDDNKEKDNNNNRTYKRRR